MRLAVIPARGGSKRIPQKNIRKFHDKPIIVYSIEAAQASNCFDRIIVSTDDHEIAEIAVQYGAEVPFLRPAELASDFCGTFDVVRHAIDFQDKTGEMTTSACCIYPTAPMVTGSVIRAGWDLLKQSGKRFVFTATEFEFPVQRALRRTQLGEVAPMYPEFIAMRSQDLEPALHDAGQFYWGDAAAYREHLDMFSEHATPLMLERWKYIDIDNENDWIRAERIFGLLASAK